MAYGSSRYSRGSSRRQRRRRRIILGSVLGAILLAGAGTAAALFGLPQISDGGGGSSTLSANRFEGLGSVTIPEGAEESLWWTTQAVDTVTDVPGSVVAATGQYSRTRVPADLLFAADSFTLSNDAKSTIKKFATKLASIDSKIYVVCYSSNDGPQAQRKPLSMKRANTLATFLESILGRPANSIERVGRGDKDLLPNIDPDSATGRALNRRCEIYVEN